MFMLRGLNIVIQQQSRWSWLDWFKGYLYAVLIVFTFSLFQNHRPCLTRWFKAQIQLHLLSILHFQRNYRRLYILQLFVMTEVMKTRYNWVHVISWPYTNVFSLGKGFTCALDLIYPSYLVINYCWPCLFVKELRGNWVDTLLFSCESSSLRRDNM